MIRVPTQVAFLTARDVATAMAVDVHTVRRWVSNGTFVAPLRTPGGDMRFRKADIADWIAAHLATDETSRDPASER